ncbi:MAG: holo-ACP synthase [Chloroflexi bacterium]|nr:holo-ACP synthase [Chloroflexota bacterium]
MERVQVKTGLDLVRVEDFRRSMEAGGDAFLRRLYSPVELQGASVERLAGIFAAKEAAYKALGLPKGNWLVVEVRHDDEGRPRLAFAREYDASHILSCDVSISHHGEYVVASVVALVGG